MVSRRTNFGERSEPAPDGGGKLQSAGGRHKVTFRHCHISKFFAILTQILTKQTMDMRSITVISNNKQFRNIGIRSKND